MLTNTKFALLGAGVMGGALVRRFIQSGTLAAKNVTIYDTFPQKAEDIAGELGAIAVNEIESAVKSADIIMLAVKPHIVTQVLNDIAPFLNKKPLIISIAAGVRTETMEAIVKDQAAVIRCMPNTPALVEAGAAALCMGKNSTKEQMQDALALLGSAGLSVEVEEKWMDAVTGVSGSGPAYVYMIIEAMADGGVLMGLPRDTARKLAAQTVMGAAKMVLESTEHPARLKDNVTTPGGTTIAGLTALERGGLRPAIINAVEAATKRAKELS